MMLNNDGCFLKQLKKSKSVRLLGENLTKKERKIVEKDQECSSYKEGYIGVCVKVS